MKNLSEKSSLIKTLKDANIPYFIHIDPQCIMEEALKMGAKGTVCVRDVLDFAFNSRGKLIGTFTSYKGSFMLRKKKT